jgi:hypothetical protein
MTKITLFSFYSDNFLPLKTFFEESLLKVRDAGLAIDIQRVELPPSCTDILERWKHTSGIKVAKIIENIRKHMGRQLVYSDIDIVFFRKPSPVILASLKRHDLVFQRENISSGDRTVNTGFIAMNCTQAVLDFWQAVYDENSRRPSEVDQTIVNEMLARSRITARWGHFPMTVAATGHSGLFPPINAVLFHANCTLALDEKIVMLQTACDNKHNTLHLAYRRTKLFLGRNSPWLVRVCKFLSGRPF